MSDTTPIIQADRVLAASFAVITEFRELILAGRADHFVMPIAQYRVDALEAAAQVCEEASGNAMANGYSEAAEGMGDAAEIIRGLKEAE